jgi:hypothetical protein
VGSAESVLAVWEMSDLSTLRPAAVLAEQKPHGTRIKYMGGCRCADCRGANASNERVRAQARKNGDWNGIVSAAPARAHIKKLARLGLGRRAVALVSDVRDKTIQEIKLGRKTRIRARSARRILDVTPDMHCDKALVPAQRTWSLIRRLLDEGYTRARLAKLLGYTTRALQIHKSHVTARNALRVEQLYERLTT